jgi:hypothetical protein
MATFHKTITDFTGGLMSPHLRGRIDIDKFNKGLKQMENFLPSIQGPTRYREGFKWLGTESTGNVKLIDFSINNENRYLITLSAGRINVYSRGGVLLFTRIDGTNDEFGNLVSIPYTDDQINDVRWSPEVDTMVFTHPLYKPYQLTANSDWVDYCLYTVDGEELLDSDSSPVCSEQNGVVGATEWKWSEVKFTAHPFQKVDTSLTVLRLGEELEAIRVESDAPNTFILAVEASALAGGLNANVVYTEYKIGDQWSLGRVLDSTTTPVAPANPTGTVVYVDAVSKVVNVKDPSARLFMIKGKPFSFPRAWTHNDGVRANEVHVRSDTLIFRTSHIGAWVRVGDEQLFTNVCDPVGSAGYNSQDGNVRWGKITDYRGVEDHPVDFLTGSLFKENGGIESGLIYSVYEWDQVTSLLTFAAGFDGVWDGSGGNSGYPGDRALMISQCDRNSNNRFQAGAFVNMYASSYPTPAAPETYGNIIIADMNTQRQFDVVEIGDVLQQNKSGYPKLISPPSTATLSAYDLVTDPDEKAFHTGVVSSSKIFFNAERDNGRYLLGAILDNWVLMKIKSEGTTDKQAAVDIISSVPLSELTGEIANNGVFTKFRMGAWYKDNWPFCVSFYEQRRVFAGTTSHPNMVWLSNLNDPTDFRTAEEEGEVLDTTGITYQLGTSSTIIRWLAAGPTLICGTEANEWQLRPNEFSAAITPSNIRITQETSVGSSIQGIRTGSAVFFPHISGKQFHEFKYDFQSQQFVVSTVTKLVPDLFETDRIIAMTFQYYPNSSFWLVTEKGKLFSLTYRKEDDYYAWAVHSTPNGLFKDVVVLPKGDTENAEDQLWAIVARNGENHLERMALQFTDDLSDNYKSEAAYLDSHVRNPVTGSFTIPTAAINVPARIIQDGKVRVVVDGVDLGNISVVAGVNLLPDGLLASQYTLIGVPYVGKLELNPLSFDNGSGKNSYGQITRTVSFFPYVYKSMGYKVGFSEDELETIAPKGGESLYTGFIDEHNIIASQFDVDKTPIIVQDKPYPLTLVSAVLKTEM